MSARLTATALLALGIGLGTLFLLDGVASTVVGVALVVVGLLGAGVAGLRGVTPGSGGAQRNAAADTQRDGATSANMERAAETGRWPRIIGGG